MSRLYMNWLKLITQKKQLERYLSKQVLFSIADTGQVKEESRRAQFLIPVDADGQNRAEASLERAQFLNPMVEVKADTEQVESKPDDFFYQFDAVSAGTSFWPWVSFLLW